jgi:hypothetical protein
MAEFQEVFNDKHMKDVIKFVSSNQRLSEQLIKNVMKENYDNDEYWKYLIEKVTISDEFILENLDKINLKYLIKYHKLNNNILSNIKFIKTVMDTEQVNELVKYHKVDNKMLDYIVNTYPHIDEEFWFNISKYQILNEDFMRMNDQFLNWKNITIYQGISIEFITDYIDKIYWSDIGLNLNLYATINNNTIKLFENFPIWDNIMCLKGISTNTLINYLHKMNIESINKLIQFRELNFYQIEKILDNYNDNSIFTTICGNQELNSEFINKHFDKIDWTALSENYDFTVEEINMYKDKIDYIKLSHNDNFDDLWLNEITKLGLYGKLDINYLKHNDYIKEDL